MSHDITRRDFLDGVALAIAATAIPGSVSLAQSARPPALTGLRGSHDGAFEVAHRLALQGETFSIDPLPVEESYDLVVVGAGVSGLAAAHFYRRRFGRRTRILILDNHDDVGGHAKRNEFMVGGRLLLSYGGSESLQSPKAYFSDAVKGLMAELGVTVDRFETFFDRKLYGSLGLQRATFFDAATFGADRLVTGDPTVWVSDDTVPGQRPERPIEDFIADFPMSIEARRQLLALHTEPRRILPDLAEEGREAKLKRMSYPDFLKVQWGVGDEALQYFRQRTHDYFGLPPTFVSAYDAWHAGYPGFQGLGGEPDASVTEPYIYHFPDGNASVVRLLVRRLVPQAIPGSTMEDIILAPLAYDRLDRPENSVRIRLSSTVVRAQNRKGSVDLGYVRNGRLTRVRATHAVMAGWNMMIPHMIPAAPAVQAAALALNVKMPLVYAKVALSDWRAAERLKVHEIYAPGAFFARTKLDYPVSMGGYHCPRDPSEPMVLHMVHVPTSGDGFADPRDALRAGRAQLLGMPFSSYETEIKSQLDRMLGPGGFEAARDIRAITVNRWSHGYSASVNSLVDDLPATEKMIQNASPAIGRIAIANADREWEAYLHSAIDAADAAVSELTGTTQGRSRNMP